MLSYPLDIVLNQREVLLSENEIFRICEAWFEIPSNKKINELIKEWHMSICHHWAIRKYGKSEILVISFLSVENFIKAKEILTNSEKGHNEKIKEEEVYAFI